jgi:hypothetical protein
MEELIAHLKSLTMQKALKDRKDGIEIMVEMNKAVLDLEEKVDNFDEYLNVEFEHLNSTLELSEALDRQYADLKSIYDSIPASAFQSTDPAHEEIQVTSVETEDNPDCALSNLPDPGKPTKSKKNTWSRLISHATPTEFKSIPSYASIIP